MKWIHSIKKMEGEEHSRLSRLAWEEEYKEDDRD